jgi:hypothetical protein
MDNFTTYGSWYRLLKQSRPEAGAWQVQNLALLMVGLLLARHVYLSRIVQKWPVPAKLVSLTRRLSRFLDQGGVVVRDWYGAVARHWLAAAHAGGELHLIIDGSKVGFGHQLLTVGLAYRRRAVPLAWTWVQGVKGHSSGATQLALLRYVRTLLPAGARVSLVGDSEFSRLETLRALRTWGWTYALRVRGNWLVCAYHCRTWDHFENLVQAPGEQVWWEKARFTQKFGERVNLLAYWAPGEKEPWLLVTNLPNAYRTRQSYARRMWIEALFGDLKDHGWDLEATQLRHFLRLSRLTLAVCLLYVWLLRTGRAAIKAGRRAWVDRNDRRDLSLFQIGLRTIDRLLALDLPITISIQTSPLLSGG